MTDRFTELRAPATDASSAAGETVFLRPLGTPMPVGLFGLAAASLVSAALELGWIPPTQRLLFGIDGAGRGVTVRYRYKF